MWEEERFHPSIFPEGKMPKIPLENPLDGIFITDTTFRDGLQSMEPLTPEQALALFDFLNRLEGGRGVITQTEVFIYSKTDLEILRRMREREYEFPEITTWIRAAESDFELVKTLRIDETGMLMSVSDHHISAKFKGDENAAFKNYVGTAEKAFAHGINVRAHFEDITRARMGFAIPLAERLLELALEYGGEIKIRICDTLGLGLPFLEAGLPRSVPRIVRLLREAGYSQAQLEFHGHNDMHMATANSFSAWLHGCGGVNCTLLGIGERTGNTPLEGMLSFYSQLTGKEFDFTIVSELAEYMKGIGVQVPDKMPYVGADAFKTRAGIHVDGGLKRDGLYVPFPPELLGRREEFAITEKSGTAGVVRWILDNFGEKLDKSDPRVARWWAEIQEQYDNGRVTSISDSEMLRLAQKHGIIEKSGRRGARETGIGAGRESGFVVIR